MRDTQKKILEWIEAIVTAYNGTGAALEQLVNHSSENRGHIYVQPTGCFSNVIECSFVFESRFAVFDFGQAELQVDYAVPETVMRVLDRFRCAVAAHVKGHGKRPALVRAWPAVGAISTIPSLVRYSAPVHRA
ncbi:MAG TPA: hypothetical protein VK466_10970 [Terriglobales bacterium]|nr:hypothetical protein [Terriglobales bacterium]